MESIEIGNDGTKKKTRGLFDGPDSTATVWGSFPEQDELSGDPVKIKDLPAGTVITALGLLEYDTRFGRSVTIFGTDPDGNTARFWVPQSVAKRLIAAAPLMGFPYKLKVVKGFSEKYKRAWTSLEDAD